MSKNALTTAEFIRRARAIHGNKYDYSKVVYINSRTKVCIICKEHGEFWQTPAKHLQCHGCPKCNRSHLEEEIASLLTENNIEYIEQYSDSFLKNGKGLQKLDFYLPKYKIAIECQGEQHFTGVFYIKNKTFKQTFERDYRKYYKCKNQGIKILYFTSKHLFQLKEACKIYNDDNIFADKQQLLDKILSSNSQ